MNLPRFSIGDFDFKEASNKVALYLKNLKINSYIYFSIMYVFLMLVSTLSGLLNAYSIIIDFLYVISIVLVISLIPRKRIRQVLTTTLAVIIFVGFIANDIYYIIYGEVASVYYIPMIFTEFRFVVEVVLFEMIAATILTILLGIITWRKVDVKFIENDKFNLKYYQNNVLKCLVVVTVFTFNIGAVNLADNFSKRYYKEYADYIVHFNDEDKKYVELYGMVRYLLKDPFRDFISDRYEFDSTGYPGNGLSDEENIDLMYGNINNSLTGINTGNNLVMIQLETLDYIGWEHYPNLNNLMQNSVFFKNYYSGTIGPGYTCATEFMVETGFLAYTDFSGTWKSGVCDTFDEVKFSDYGTIGGYFSDRGYTTKWLHKNYDTYSRDKLYPNYGYDEYIFADGELPYRDDVAFGILNDQILTMSENDEKFLIKYIMYESHDATRKPDRYTEVYEEFMNSGVSVYTGFDDRHSLKLNTSTAVNMITDKYIGELFTMLEENDLLDTTDVLIYSDHDNYSMPYISDMLETGGYRPDFANDNSHHAPALYYSKNLESYFGLNENSISAIDLHTLIVNLYGFNEPEGVLKYGNDPMLEEQERYYIYDSNGIMLSSDNLNENDPLYISYLNFHKKRIKYSDQQLENFLKKA